MKDALGHGSNGKGGAGKGMVKISVQRPIGYTIHDVGPGGVKTLVESGTLSPGAHSEGVQAVGQNTVYIDKHPDLGGEMKVTLKGGPKSHGYYTDDKNDAISTARAMYGQNATIKHRRKAYD